jgi:hypothetical protein
VLRPAFEVAKVCVGGNEASVVNFLEVFVGDKEDDTVGPKRLFEKQGHPLAHVGESGATVGKVDDVEDVDHVSIGQDTQVLVS